MSAKSVLDRLEQMGVVDPQVLAELRRHVQEAKFVVTGEAVLKLLVDKRQLPPYLARKIFGDLQKEQGIVPTAKEPIPAVAKKPAKPVDDEMELIPLDEPPPKPSKPAPPSSEIDLESSLPPYVETPIKATAIPTEAPPPADQQPRQRHKRVIPPAPPKGVTTDDLLTPIPSTDAPKRNREPAPPVAADEEPIELIPLGESEVRKPSAPPVIPPVATPKTFKGGPAAKAPEPSAKKGPAPPALPSAPADLLSELTPLGSPAPLNAGDPLGVDLGAVEQAEPVAPPEKKKLKKVKAGTWDSALMLLGGGALILLILIGIGLFYAIRSGSSQEILDKADEAYRSGSYPTSQTLYEKLVKDFPSDPNVSAAKVRIGMAKLRQVFDGASDYSPALKVAKTTLPTIEGETQFDAVARPELQTILPDIADSFATKAKTATEAAQMEKFVALARDALELVNNPSYLPTTRRKDQQPRIDAIQEKIAIAQRAINQDKALVATVQKMEEKVQQSDILGAFQERELLLQQYPALEQHQLIVKTTDTLSEQEKGLISLQRDDIPGVSTDSPAMPQATLFKTKGSSLSGVEGRIWPVLARGAVFGIDLASGQLKWKRFVGLETRSQPQLFGSGEVLATDERTWEIVKLKADTGALVWKHVVGEPFLAPVVSGDQVFITLNAGRLKVLKGSSGAQVAEAKFPQPTTAGAGADAKSRRIYLPANRSTLYVLRAPDDDGAGMVVEESFPLGHRPGSIAVPPLVSLEQVFVCENAGADFSYFHMLHPGEDGKLQRTHDPMRLRGRVTVPMTASGKRVMVITDLGDGLICNIDASNPKEPVTVAAKFVGRHTQPTASYAIIEGTKIFVADTQLSDFELVATRQTLDNGKSFFDGDSFLAPLHVLNGNLFHLRKPRGSSSVVLTGAALKGSATWQTELAPAVAALFSIPDKKQFGAMTSSGDKFELPPDAFTRNATIAPVESGPTGIRVGPAVSLTDGSLLLPDTEGRRWLTLKGDGASKIAAADVGTPSALSQPPMPFGEGVLGTISEGSVWWLDPKSGKPLRKSLPFLPPLTPQAEVQWLPPAVVDNERFVAVSRGLRSMYLVRRVEQPTLQFVEQRKWDLDGEPISVAVGGSVIYIAVRKSTADEVRGFRLPGGEPIEPHLVEERLASRGFDALGDRVGWETMRGAYWRLQPTGEIAWKTALPCAPLATKPLLLGDQLLCVGQTGQLATVNDQGESQLLGGVTQPLTGAVKVVGNKLLAASVDGSVQLIPISPKP